MCGRGGGGVSDSTAGTGEHGNGGGGGSAWEGGGAAAARDKRRPRDVGVAVGGCTEGGLTSRRIGWLTTCPVTFQPVTSIPLICAPTQKSSTST